MQAVYRPENRVPENEINLRTAESWTAADLASVLEALDGIYTCICLLGYLERYGRNPPHPIETTSDLDAYLDNPGLYMADSEQLSVVAISMASPGLISLKGADGIIRQLRELIKDICYRNRQERQKGEIDIAMASVKLFTALSKLPVSSANVLAVEVLEDAKLVARVIGTGQLTLEGELPTRPGDALPQKAIARRRRSK